MRMTHIINYLLRAQYHCPDHLRVEDEVEANLQRFQHSLQKFSMVWTYLVCRTMGLGVVQLLGVKSKTERSLDTRAEVLRISCTFSQLSSDLREEESHTESNDTGIVDLGLNECRGVQEALKWMSWK